MTIDSPPRVQQRPHDCAGWPICLKTWENGAVSSSVLTHRFDEPSANSSATDNLVELPDEFVLPRYGGHCLADVMPAVARSLGLDDREWSGRSAPADPMAALPQARHWVVMLVDGMGRNLVQEHASLAPFLTRMNSIPDMTCAVPSTTATSLTCLGTGMEPGHHGTLGYTFRSPEGPIMNALSWANGPDPLTMQARPTAFERLAEHGVETFSIGPAGFATSGLTQSGLRGPRYLSVRDEDDIDLRAELVADTLRGTTASVSYVYERSLDHVGHGSGCRSAQWRRRLTWTDELVEAIGEVLTPDSALVVTADHGMVDVPEDHMIIAEDQAGLLADVDELGGEPRTRHVYTDHPDEVAERWRSILADRAMVLTADQALHMGLLGKWDPAMRNRLGDVLAFMRGQWAVMTRQMPREMSLIGMHGSLTDDEMLIPLLYCEG